VARCRRIPADAEAGALRRQVEGAVIGCDVDGVLAEHDTGAARSVRAAAARGAASAKPPLLVPGASGGHPQAARRSGQHRRRRRRGGPCGAGSCRHRGDARGVRPGRRPAAAGALARAAPGTDGPDVLVRVPQQVWPFTGTTAGPAVLAADLLESDEPRAVMAGAAWLDSHLADALAGSRGDRRRGPAGTACGPAAAVASAARHGRGAERTVDPHRRADGVAARARARPRTPADQPGRRRHRGHPRRPRRDPHRRRPARTGGLHARRDEPAAAGAPVRPHSRAAARPVVVDVLAPDGVGGRAEARRSDGPNPSRSSTRAGSAGSRAPRSW
jgi:hypothetical protein